jgi:hypothetical protein
MGLIIRWSEYPDWIKLHDPTSGEWNEVRAEECLPEIVETANKCRKNKGGAERKCEEVWKASVRTYHERRRRE